MPTKKTCGIKLHISIAALLNGQNSQGFPTLTMKTSFYAAFWLVLTTFAFSQPSNMDDVEVKVTHIAGSFHMLEGRGGNIGISIGSDGVFMVDDQFAPLTETILAAITELTDQPVSFIVNTHLHGDHVGGNENLRKMGAYIIAHDLVRDRLKHRTVNRQTGILGPGAPESALPDITYSQLLTLHYNDEEIRVIKMPPAHTDGDSIVQFTKSNVIHTGDVFRTTTYPVIDTNHGGTFQGTLDTLSYLIQIGDTETIYVPGHGVPASKGDIMKWRKMLTTIAQRIQQSVDKGDALDEALARNPGLEFNHRWSAESGFASTKVFMTTIYNELSAR